MTLDQLRYFIAAAKYEHIHRAAQSIPISASVISQAVKALEEEMGCELFTRENKKMRLTSQGIHLLELSAKLLNQAENIKKELGKADLPLTGHYRVGASNFLATKVIAPVWTALQTKFSGLTVEITSQPTWSLIDTLLAGRIDFALGFSPTPHPQLETEEVFRGNSEIVVRKNHPIFSRVKSNHYKLLAEYPATMHLATEKVIGARSHPVLRALNLDRTVTFGFDNDFVALENLKKSNNWSFMLDVVAADFSKHLRTIAIPKKSEVQYTIQLIKHKSRRMDAVMNEVFGLIKQQVNELKKLE